MSLAWILCVHRDDSWFNGRQTPVEDFHPSRSGHKGPGPRCPPASHPRCFDLRQGLAGRYSSAHALRRGQQHAVVRSQVIELGGWAMAGDDLDLVRQFVDKGGDMLGQTYEIAAVVEVDIGKETVKEKIT